MHWKIYRNFWRKLRNLSKHIQTLKLLQLPARKINLHGKMSFWCYQDPNRGLFAGSYFLYLTIPNIPKKRLWPRIYVKYHLSFPQKNHHQRKMRQTKCLLFNFWMIKFTVIPKEAIWHLAIWQNWCFGQFYPSKIEKQTLSLSQFSLVTGFFEGTIENILHIFWAFDKFHDMK